VLYPAVEAIFATGDAFLITPLATYYTIGFLVNYFPIVTPVPKYLVTDEPTVKFPYF
jgi:hypothetical protein